MSDFDEGLVIGLSFGRNDSPAYRSDVFHDILDNSEAWLDAPIDDRFKYTASLWYTERFEVYDSGYRWYTHGRDSDGVYYEKMPMTYRKNLYPVLTAWMNDTPLFSKLYSARTLNEDEKAATWKDKEHGNINRTFYYNTPIYTYIRNSAEFIGDDIRFNYNDGFNHSIYVPNFRWRCIKKNYTEVPRQDSSEMPVIVFESEEEVTQDYGWSANINTMPDYNGTFSDISYSEIISKYNEITEAIYAANGAVLRNCLLLPSE